MKTPQVLRSRWKGEHNDCTVRAFAVAFNLDYSLAHALLQANGRKLRRRFNSNHILEATIASKISLDVAFLGDVKLLDQDFSYIVETRGHLVGFRDGVHSDAGVCPLKRRARIKVLWRISKGAL